MAFLVDVIGFHLHSLLHISRLCLLPQCLPLLIVQSIFNYYFLFCFRLERLVVPSFFATKNGSLCLDPYFTIQITVFGLLCFVYFDKLSHSSLQLQIFLCFRHFSLFTQPLFSVLVLFLRPLSPPQKLISLPNLPLLRSLPLPLT